MKKIFTLIACFFLLLGVGVCSYFFVKNMWRLNYTIITAVEIALFIIVFLILFMVYLSKENRERIFSYVKRNFTAFISLVTAFATLFTLVEMRQERIQSYKPFIVLESKASGMTYYLNEKETDQYIIPCYKVDDVNRNGVVTVFVRNIGAGVAKQIDINYSIDTDGLKDRNYDEFFTKYNARALPKHNNFSIITYEHLVEYLYLLPGGQDQFSFQIPKEYLQAYEEYRAYRYENKIVGPFSFPTFYVSVQFTDVQNISYKQVFHFDIQSSFTETNGILEKELDYHFNPIED